MSQFEDSCQLEISRVYPEDEGEYSCVATNGGGSVSCTATLTLDGEFTTLHNGAFVQQVNGSEPTFAFVQTPFWCTSESSLFGDESMKLLPFRNSRRRAAAAAHRRQPHQ